LKKELFQKQLENEDLRQRLQILEALTGRDTSFISIMEDSANKDFSHDLANPSATIQSQRTAVSKTVLEKPYNTITVAPSKPPKVRKYNVAVGNFSASSYNNLSILGHKTSN